VEDVDRPPPELQRPDAELAEAVERRRHRAELEAAGLGQLLEREAVVGEPFVHEHPHQVVALGRPQPGEQAVEVAADAVELVLQEAPVHADAQGAPGGRGRLADDRPDLHAQFASGLERPGVRGEPARTAASSL
jgi:hypothetical protein